MAASHSTEVPRRVRELGFVREIFDIAKAAGARAELDVEDDGEAFCVPLSGDDDRVLEAQRGGLPRRWSVPLSVDCIAGGRIERQRLPDHYGVDRVAYWGFPEDLVAAGVTSASRVQRGIRWSKACGAGRSRWSSHFAPSGRVLYCTSRQPEDEWSRQEPALREAIDRGEHIDIIRIEMPTGTRWVGTKEDLIAAGICAERHFPVPPKRLASAHDDADRPGIEGWGTQAIRRGYFEHYVRWDDDGLARRARDVKPEEATRDQSASDCDPEDFADRCETFFMSASGMMIKMISGDLLHSEALRYDTKTVENVRSALDHARQLLQSSMPALPRSVVQRNRRVAAAKGDDAFRTFMAAALEAPKKA